MRIDLVGPVTGSSVRVNSVLAAEEVNISLPAITFNTYTLNAMGQIEIVSFREIKPMEATITKVGIDSGLGLMIVPGISSYEIRWIQTRTDTAGVSVEEGGKAFINAAPKSIPGFGVEPGSTSDNDISLAVYRYQLFMGGEEYCLVDPLNGKLRIHGRDYISSNLL